jgi:hypothetical protein
MVPAQPTTNMDINQQLLFIDEKELRTGRGDTCQGPRVPVCG